jgi:hypothetical protein
MSLGTQFCIHLLNRTLNVLKKGQNRCNIGVFLFPAYMTVKERTVQLSFTYRRLFQVQDQHVLKAFKRKLSMLLMF